MKNLKYILALLVCLPAFILFGIGMNAIDSSGYVVKSKKSSPSGQYTAYEIESVSQEGPAPHGLHLVLSNKKLVRKPDHGDVLFAGYCHPPLRYSWKSDSHINIQCKPNKKENIGTQAQAKSIRGIQIEIQYVQ